MELSRKNEKIVISWIPAHIGVTGNEIVNRRAKEATEEKSPKEIEVLIGDLIVLLTNVHHSAGLPP